VPGFCSSLFLRNQRTLNLIGTLKLRGAPGGGGGNGDARRIVSNAALSSVALPLLRETREPCAAPFGLTPNVTTTTPCAIAAMLVDGLLRAMRAMTAARKASTLMAFCPATACLPFAPPLPLGRGCATGRRAGRSTGFCFGFGVSLMTRGRVVAGAGFGGGIKTGASASAFGGGSIFSTGIVSTGVGSTGASILFSLWWRIGRRFLRWGLNRWGRLFRNRGLRLLHGLGLVNGLWLRLRLRLGWRLLLFRLVAGCAGRFDDNFDFNRVFGGLLRRPSAAEKDENAGQQKRMTDSGKRKSKPWAACRRG
jgi:hypothetical protein